DGGITDIVDGGSAGCTPPPCMPTDSGSTVCGQIVDLSNGRPVTDPSVHFAVRAIVGAPPTVDELRIDSCGYFTARGIHAPANAQLVFEVGDNAVRYDGTAYLLPYPLSDGSLVNGVTLPALRKVTDDAWTQAAGETQRFADQGATLFTFR